MDLGDLFFIVSMRVENVLFHNFGWVNNDTVALEDTALVDLSKIG